MTLKASAWAVMWHSEDEIDQEFVGQTPEEVRSYLNDDVDESTFEIVPLVPAAYAEALIKKIREAKDHQTPMGSSFHQWHQEVVQILQSALSIEPEQGD